MYHNKHIPFGLYRLKSTLHLAKICLYNHIIEWILFPLNDVDNIITIRVGQMVKNDFTVTFWGSNIGPNSWDWKGCEKKKINKITKYPQHISIILDKGSIYIQLQ